MYYFKIKFFFSKESAFMSLLFLKREYGIFEKKNKENYHNFPIRIKRRL